MPELMNWMALLSPALLIYAIVLIVLEERSKRWFDLTKTQRILLWPSKRVRYADNILTSWIAWPFWFISLSMFAVFGFPELWLG